MCVYGNAFGAHRVKTLLYTSTIQKCTKCIFSWKVVLPSPQMAPLSNLICTVQGDHLWWQRNHYNGATPTAYLCHHGSPCSQSGSHDTLVSSFTTKSFAEVGALNSLTRLREPGNIAACVLCIIWVYVRGHSRVQMVRWYSWADNQPIWGNSLNQGGHYSDLIVS